MGTAAKYSYGDRTRCRTRVRTGPLPRRQGLPIPGSERGSGAAEQEECSSFQSCATWPVAGVQRARSAVSRLTVAADAGGQSGLVLSAVAGIAPVLVDEMGAGARSRPARRRPGLAARAAAPVRVAASSSSGQGLSGCLPSSNWACSISNAIWSTSSTGRAGSAPSSIPRSRSTTFPAIR